VSYEVVEYRIDLRRREVRAKRFPTRDDYLSSLVSPAQRADGAPAPLRRLLGDLARARERRVEWGRGIVTVTLLLPRQRLKYPRAEG
jgi:hypothetical protein